jgi:hypothetical protein
LLQNPALEQLTFENWQSTCELFKIPSNTKTSVEDKFKIPGSNHGFFPHQLLGIWFMITRGTIGFRGGIVADDPGVGKTAQVIGLILVKRWLFLAGDDVQLARNSREPATRSRHLPASTLEMPQPADAKCPSQDQWGVQCPCVQSGVSASIFPTLSRGPTIIVPPPGAIKVWSDELVNFVDPKEKSLQLEWFVYHESALSTLHYSRNNEVLCDRHTKKAPIGSERFIFLTSAKCIETRLTAAFQQPNWQPYGTKGKKKQVGYLPGISWGLMVRDELQLDHRPGTNLSTYFASPHHWSNNPEKWALSGTPFEVTPEDLTGHLQSFELPAWSSTDHRYYRSSSAYMKEAASTYKKITSGQDVSPETAVEIVAALNEGLARFMIRRKENSNFLGYPILNLPVYKVILRECPIKPAWIEVVVRVEAELKAKTEEDFQRRMITWNRSGRQGPEPKKAGGAFTGNAWLLRLCGGFPEFATMLDEDAECSFKSVDINKNGWAKDWKESPFYTRRIRLAESSMKFSETLKIMKEIRKGEDPERPEKFIVLSFNPATAVTLQCVSLSIIPHQSNMARLT